MISELLTKGVFKFEDIDVQERAPGEFYINIISNQDAVILIGHSGEVLLALQHLIKNMLRNSGVTDEKDYVKIDIDSYRIKQEGNVMAMADKRAKMVMETGRTEVLPSMSSFFRRMVHLHVKENFPQLTTYSQGDGNYRSVYIALATGSPAEDGAGDLYVDMDI